MVDGSCVSCGMQSQPAGLVAAIAGAAAASNQLPQISSLSRSPDNGDLQIGQIVTIAATVEDPEGRPLNARLTLYGIPPRNCGTASCGDLQVQASGTGQISLSTSAAYQRAGRFTVRVEASDGLGRIVSADISFIVRKLNDTNRIAPCCRYTGQHMAQGFSRPINLHTFRHPSVYTLGSLLGWTTEYLDNDDLEAERLFDYSLLTPSPMEGSPLQTRSCADARLAGADSPVISALQPDRLGTQLGHGKRLAIVPQGYDWADEAYVQKKPSCETHWSSWEGSSPQKMLLQAAAPGRPAKYCSYTCTPEGVDMMIQQLGTLERVMEDYMEVTYGRVSFNWDVLVTPTNYLPYDSNASSPFMYHHIPAEQHLSSLGVDPATDVHTVLVLAPFNPNVNPGYVAWSGGVSSPMNFVLRCNPQHYYLLHEIGHHFGMAHASVYKLTGASNGPRPVDPAGPGVIEDSYSDKLDIMACCRGDFNLHGRIMAGWVRGDERSHIPYSAVTSTNATQTSRFVLWPFDRAEARGKLKGVTMRTSGDTVLVLGYRSLPQWADARVGRFPTDAGDGDFIADESRNNLRGLSVELVKRYLDNSGVEQWTVRGLLDFNVLFHHFPSALPDAAGEYAASPEMSAYALLKEGQAWVDQKTGTMVGVERIAECDSEPEVPVYSYSARNFYGARGEAPGQETPERADYRGHSSLDCLHLVVRTGVNATPGMLDARVSFAEVNQEGGIPLHASCGFRQQPALQVTWPSWEPRPISIIWRDNLNQTIARDKEIVVLPPLVDLVEGSGTDAGRCIGRCYSSYSVQLLGLDGQQTRIEIRLTQATITGYSISTRNTYYMPDRISTISRTLTAPFLKAPPPSRQAPQGVSLIQGGPVPLQHPMLVFGVEQLTDSSCSRQWTITAVLQVQQVPLISDLQLWSMGGPDAEHPVAAVQLRRSYWGTTLALLWNGYTHIVNITSLVAPAAVHVAVARDGDRLGAWVDGEGSWAVPDVWCIPARPTITYCDHPPSGSGFEVASLRVAGGVPSAAASLTSLRMYNYAIPPSSLAAEASCAAMGSCGSFMLAGWQVPSGPEQPLSSEGDDWPVMQPPTPTVPSNGYYLQVGDWGACSAVCGGGVTTRTVTCLKMSEGHSSEVDISLCGADPVPPSSQPCNTLACPWSELTIAQPPSWTCSGSCGGVEQYLELHCSSNQGHAVPLATCMGNATSAAVQKLNATLAAVNGSEGVLQQLMGSCGGAACGRYSWRNGPWSPCSASCGGGIQTRTSICWDADAGVQTAGKSCDAAAAPALTATCDTAACELHSWRVGPWGPCMGVIGIASAARRVDCVAAWGKVVDESLCIGAKPSVSVWCTKPTNLLCRPAFSSHKRDCSGKGRCSQAGCRCKQGYSGQFCEVGPSCNGVLDRYDRCCPSGAVDVTGTCCAAGAVLDAFGRCCAEGWLDACGKCAGPGKHVDAQGACCATVLDAGGLCCPSGYLDECGVCDGDSSSCGVTLTLTVALDTTQPDPSSSLRAILASALSLTPSSIFLDTAGAAGWSPPSAGNNATTTPNSSRRLTQAQAGPPPAQDAPSGLSLQTLDVIVTVPDHDDPLTAAQLTSSSFFGGGFTAVATLAKLQQLLNGSSMSPASLLNSPILAVKAVDRAGVCGNGICEVGEQLVGAVAGVGADAVVPCPDDCPFPVQTCGASPTFGDTSAPCSGRGRCLPAAGRCDCLDGYAGELCERCSAGYYPSRGLCVRQFIDGLDLWQRAASARPPMDGWMRLQAFLRSLHGVLAVAGGAGTVLLAAALIVWAVMWRRRQRGLAQGGKEKLSTARAWSAWWSQDRRVGAAAGKAGAGSPRSADVFASQGQLPNLKGPVRQRITGRNPASPATPESSRSLHHVVLGTPTYSQPTSPACVMHNPLHVGLDGQQHLGAVQAQLPRLKAPARQGAAQQGVASPAAPGSGRSLHDVALNTPTATSSMFSLRNPLHAMDAAHGAVVTPRSPFFRPSAAGYSPLPASASEDTVAPLPEHGARTWWRTDRRLGQTDADHEQQAPPVGGWRPSSPSARPTSRDDVAPRQQQLQHALSLPAITMLYNSRLGPSVGSSPSPQPGRFQNPPIKSTPPGRSAPGPSEQPRAGSATRHHV